MDLQEAATHLSEVFPWVRLLPADDQLALLREFVDALSAAAEAGPLAPVLQTITEWRNTAQVYADPELLKALRAPLTT
jgi:hypothetical protein